MAEVWRMGEQGDGPNAGEASGLEVVRRVNLLRSTRRDVLRAGLGLAATASLGGALAACANSTVSAPRATPTPSPTDTPQPTATPDTRPITVAITGDIMLGRSVNTMMVSTD